MFKKLFFFGGGFLLVGFLFLGSGLFGHISHGVSYLREQVQDQVPIEYELKRARSLLRDSDPQIRDCKRLIAEKQVETRDIEHEIATLETRRANARDALQTQQVALRSDGDVLTSNGSRVSKRVVQSRARRNLSRLKAWDQMIVAKSARLEALATSLDYATEALEKMQAQKVKLEATVDLLETKLRQTEAMEAAAQTVELDKTNLSEAAEILNRCKSKLDVIQQMIENDSPMFNEIEVRIDDHQVLNEINHYLGAKSGDAKDAVFGGGDVSQALTEIGN